MSKALNSPRLSTQRLSLRPPEPRDAARLATLANDFEVARMTSCLPFPYTLDDAEAFLRRLEARDPAREAAFAIEHPGEGLVGIIGFHPETGPAPEVRYWIGQAYWGRGYATEATRAALAWAGEGWGKRYLMSGHFADHPASGAVLSKAGFLYTGEVRARGSAARGGAAPTRMMVWLA